jgi:hypothetical protein
MMVWGLLWRPTNHTEEQNMKKLWKLFLVVTVAVGIGGIAHAQTQAKDIPELYIKIAEYLNNNPPGEGIGDFYITQKDIDFFGMSVKVPLTVENQFIILSGMLERIRSERMNNLDYTTVRDREVQSALIYIFGPKKASSNDKQVQEARKFLLNPAPSSFKLRIAGNARQGIASTGAINITASKLCEDYLENELRADNLYKGKTVQVTGVVSEIKKDYFGNYYVCLEGARKNYTSYTIDVYVVQSALNRLAAVEPGQTVIFVGKCMGKDYLSFRIADATFGN